MESFSKALPDKFELYEFKLERTLGQGGFGITYLGLDMNLMQYVAIKEYFPREFAARDSTFTIHAVGNSEDKETFAWGLKRFLDEARVLAQLSHPNIVSIKRFFEAHGTAYLVMEYCDGKPLDAVIRDHGPLSEIELDTILLPLLEGLEHVHSKAFLHRDIKPANIFIRRNGSPVLLDFGAAKHEMTSHSRSVTSLATEGYAPFEQYSTKGKQGAWSDIYALAATMYRAISGVKPQSAPDRMLEDSLEPLSSMLKGKFRPELLNAIDLAMRIRPESRPQSVREFRSLLEQREVKKSSNAPILPDLGGANISSPPLGGVSKMKPGNDSGRKDVNYESEIAATSKSSKNGKYLRIGFGILLVVSTVSWFAVSSFDQGTRSEQESTPESRAQTSKLQVEPVSIETSSKAEISLKNTPSKNETGDVNLASNSSSGIVTQKTQIPFAEVDRAIVDGQLSSAKNLLTRYIEKNPQNASAYFRLAQISVKEEKYSEARKLLDKARVIDPSLRFAGQGKFQELYNETVAMETMFKLPGQAR